MTSARRKGSPKSHPPHPFGDADSKQKLLIEQTDASVAHRVEALVETPITYVSVGTRRDQIIGVEGAVPSRPAGVA